MTYDKTPLDLLVYGIVLNDVHAQSIEKDIELAGWTFGKASEDEMGDCSHKLCEYTSLDVLGVPRQEQKIVKSGNGFLSKPNFDPSLWRYAVVRPTKCATMLGAQLAEAFRLSEADLFIELWCAKKSPKSDGPEMSIGGSPLHCLQYLAHPPIDESLYPIDIANLVEITNLRAGFDDAAYPSIVKAIEMFRSLDVNPRTPVKMLGYFAIMESLLSHAPEPNDSANSITRQLKRNLILINNRIATGENLGFDEFGSTKPETVVTKLYDFRSAIAHGGDADSKSEILCSLHTGWSDIPKPLWVSTFLRRLVKRILVHALREPQLITDLKG